MTVLAWVAAASAVVWIYLLGCRGQFWRTDQRLGRLGPGGVSGSGTDSDWPPVAIVVPARDELGVINTTLPSLLAQRYPGSAAVVLVDDRSTDGTGQVARLAQVPGGLPLTVIDGRVAPEGWAGKVWAMQQGLERVGWADWVLFTDADIEHPAQSLAGLVRAAVSARCDLVSLMARLRVVGFWERMIVPAFVYLFAQLYPFRWVNQPAAATAAAAGGCMLVRREALEAAGGLAVIAGATIDDVALARAVKRSGGVIWLGLADDVLSVRPYPGLGPLWRMVARSAFTQLRYSSALLALTGLSMAVTYLLPPVALVAGLVQGDWVCAGAGALAWLLMTLSYIPILRYYGQPAAAALALPLTAGLYLAMTLDSARRHWWGPGVAWKGRSYSAGGPGRPAPSGP